MALRLYNSYNHCPCPRPAGPHSKCSKQWKSDFHVKSWNPVSITHIIALNIDWSWNISSLHIFCSILINQHWSRSSPSEKWELRTWNLGQILKIKLRNQCGWLASYITMITFRGRLLTKNLWIKNCQVEACPVNAGLYLAFKYYFSFAAVLLA